MHDEKKILDSRGAYYCIDITASWVRLPVLYELQFSSYPTVPLLGLLEWTALAAPSSRTTRTTWYNNIAIGPVLGYGHVLDVYTVDVYSELGILAFHGIVMDWC